MRKNKTVATTLSDMYCTKCGQKGMPITRIKGQYRESGHLKRLFCLNCQEENNHVEVRPFAAYKYEDFLLEFNNNNFDEEGNRKLPFGLFKNSLLAKAKEGEKND